MRRRLAAALLAALAVSAARAEPTQTVAGGEFGMDFTQPVDSIHAEISLTPIACALDADRKHATCKVPTTLGPGHRELDVEIAVGGLHVVRALVIALRMPNIVSATPHVVGPEDRVELELDAPMPGDEPFELWWVSDRGERRLRARMLRAARMEAWLPREALPREASLVLRSHGEESRSFSGLVLDPWLRLGRSWVEWAPFGIFLGGLIAAGIAVHASGRPRPPGPAPKL